MIGKARYIVEKASDPATCAFAVAVPDAASPSIGARYTAA
jgi:hypothetical protein